MFSELRIARAYIKLLCIPESSSGARMVSLARIGDLEIRLLEGLQLSSADAPPFWMELFDHKAQVSVDSCAGPMTRSSGSSWRACSGPDRYHRQRDATAYRAHC